VSDQLDYEVELVVVIGKKGASDFRTASSDHVFGYTIGNDVSVRDWQQKTPQYARKVFRHTLSFWTEHSHSRRNHGSDVLGALSFVNGELRQNSNTRNLIFNIWQQIAELAGQTLAGRSDFHRNPGGWL
jgi:2-keto-4-pentenoate hydratase/2-oxohepta-3-ene-1,7-dioic acid hydratase in catechol pathway